MQYRYKAVTQTGETVYGDLSAVNEEQALVIIRSKELIPIDVSVKNNFKGCLQHLRMVYPENVSSKIRSIFFRQFSMLLKAGIPMDKSVQILHDLTADKKLKSAAETLLSDIRRGLSVTSSFESQSEVFTKLEIAFVHAGEVSGQLDKNLAWISEIHKKYDLLHKKVVNAFIYPASVLVVSVFVLILMTVFVLPQFENTFYQMKIEMPKFTQIVFALGGVVRKYFWLIPIVVLLTIAIVKYLCNLSTSFQRKFDSLKLKMPVFGKLIFKASVARAFRAFGLLLNSGVEMLQAMKLSGDIAGNLIIKDVFNDMISAVKEGSSLYNILERNKTFPMLVVQLVGTGEESGQTAEKFLEIADIYEEETGDMVVHINSVIEPVLILFVSVIVTVILFAAYMPILSAIKNLI